MPHCRLLQRPPSTSKAYPCSFESRPHPCLADPALRLAPRVDFPDHCLPPRACARPATPGKLDLRSTATLPRPQVHGHYHADRNWDGNRPHRQAGKQADRQTDRPTPTLKSQPSESFLSQQATTTDSRTTYPIGDHFIGIVGLSPRPPAPSVYQSYPTHLHLRHHRRPTRPVPTNFLSLPAPAASASSTLPLPSALSISAVSFPFTLLRHSRAHAHGETYQLLLSDLRCAFLRASTRYSYRARQQSCFAQPLPTPRRVLVAVSITHTAATTKSEGEFRNLSPFPSF